MSQPHTQYSFLIGLPDGVTVEKARSLIAQAEAAINWDDEAPNPIDDEVTTGCTELGIAESGAGPVIEVYADANEGDVHQAALVTRWLLDQLDSDDIVEFEWADWSSNCETYASGGGLVMVNRHAYGALGTADLHPLVAEELAAATIRARLEYLRGEIKAERISMAEIVELQGLAMHIAEDDVELLEWAGVPEHLEELRFGYVWPLRPRAARACWGARVIVTQGGGVDVVFDRTDFVGDDDDRDRLREKLSAVSGAWTAALREMLLDGRVDTRVAADVVVYEGGGVRFVGSSNASGGYFYVAAFEVPD